MNINKATSVHIIPILKYLEVLSLFSENFYFTCNYHIFKLCTECFKYNQKTNLLIDRFSYKSYYELLNDSIEQNVIVILTQEDEFDQKYKKSIGDLYLKFKSKNITKKLIIFSDRKNFRIVNQRTALREYLRNQNVIDYYDLYNCAKTNIDRLFEPKKVQSFPENILLYQFLCFLEYFNQNEEIYVSLEYLFLNTDQNYPESPLWLIVSDDFDRIIKDEDKREYKKKNFFKFLNIYYRLDNEIKTIFLKNFLACIDFSFLNPIVRNLHIRNVRDKNLLIEKLDHKLSAFKAKEKINFSTIHWIISFYKKMK